MLAPVTPRIAQALKLPVKQGALVERVASGGPAAKAGLKGGNRRVVRGGIVVGGDIIAALGGQKVTGPDDVLATLSSHSPGDQLKITYYRGSGKHMTTITLGKRPRRLPAG